MATATAVWEPVGNLSYFIWAKLIFIILVAGVLAKPDDNVVD
ncbi:MAG TPA: hypothetical protein VHP35_02640 [Terriglobia bacterium]|nr:hypothetical protein [Terriglobia bacterium]